MTFPQLSTLALIPGLMASPYLTDGCDDPGDPIPIPTPADGQDDLYMEGDDFECIQDGTKVRNMYIRNDLGYLDEALAVANSPTGGTYPVGTIIQLIPEEAMVKRFEGFSPETHDWEYFYMTVSETGAEVISRGSDPYVGPTGVTNVAANCHDCHVKAEPQWDMICEDDNGCDPLPFPDAAIEALQAGDPRCD